MKKCKKGEFKIALVDERKNITNPKRHGVSVSTEEGFSGFSEFEEGKCAKTTCDQELKVMVLIAKNRALDARSEHEFKVSFNQKLYKLANPRK